MLAGLTLGQGLPSASAEDSAAGQTDIAANYGVYWAGMHLGDVRLTVNVRGSDYQMKGDGRFALLGGLIYQWQGSTTSAGTLGKRNPRPSLYTLSYSGGDKESALRISFSNGGVAEVSTTPKKRPSPRDIPVTKDQLQGVLDPMTGAFLRSRPDLSPADLRVCDETIPVYDGQLRFNIVLTPKEQRNVSSPKPGGYSGPAAVCSVKFVPISGYRPENRAVKFMSAHTDEIEAWLVPLPKTSLYLPYRIKVPTAFGSGTAELISFSVGNP